MIRQFLASALVLGTLAFTSCGGETKDPVQYNNSIITVLNGSDTHITAMNSAMNAADYAKAEEVRVKWEKAIDTDVKTLEDLGDFNGDDNFRKAVLDGLKGYRKIVTEDYPKLIDIRKNNADDQAGEATLLDNINTAFENMANNVNKASDEFESKYAK